MAGTEASSRCVPPGGASAAIPFAVRSKLFTLLAVPVGAETVGHPATRFGQAYHESLNTFTQQKDTQNDQPADSNHDLLSTGLIDTIP